MTTTRPTSSNFTTTHSKTASLNITNGQVNSQTSQRPTSDRELQPSNIYPTSSTRSSLTTMTPTTAPSLDPTFIPTISHHSRTPSMIARTSHAERLLQTNLAAEAAKALASSLKVSQTTTAIAAAGNSKLRQHQLEVGKEGKPTWSTCVEETQVRKRTVFQVPIHRLLTFPHFLGLFGEMGTKDASGTVALFLSALWLYAQAVPPTTSEHVTSELQQSTSIGSTISTTELAPDAIATSDSIIIQGGKAVKVTSSFSSVEERRSTKPPATTAASFITPRGAIIGSQFNMGLVPSSSSHQGGGLSSIGFRFTRSPSGQPQDLASVADSIILFLLDDMLSEVRNHSPKRYFRASDRSLFDHYLRGHPELITRFSGVSDEEVEAERIARLQAKRAAREKRQQERKEVKEEENEEDDDVTYNVSLKDSSDDDGEDSEDDQFSPSGLSTSDSLSFKIEENLFSVDQMVTNSNGTESRLTTRYLSSDLFQHTLFAIRLKSDRSSGWKIYDFYCIFHGSAQPPPPPIPIPTKFAYIEPTTVAQIKEKAIAAIHGPAIISPAHSPRIGPSTAASPAGAPLVEPVYDKPRASIFALMASGVPTPANGYAGTSTYATPVGSRRPSVMTSATTIGSVSVELNPVNTHPPAPRLVGIEPNPGPFSTSPILQLVPAVALQIAQHYLTDGEVRNWSLTSPSTMQILRAYELKELVTYSQLRSGVGLGLATRVNITFSECLKQPPTDRLTQIRHISLMDDPEDVDAAQMIQWVSDSIQLSRCQKLRSIDFLWCDIGDTGAEVVSRMISLCPPSLTELVLSHCHIGRAGTIAIAQAVRTSSVTHLNLEWNRIGDEGAIALSEAIQASDSKIQFLDVRESKICRRGFLSLIDGIKRSPSLRTFKFCESELADDECMQALADSIQSSHTLTELVLDNCELNDRAIQLLGSAIVQSQTMKILHLDKNAITDAGALSLADMITHSTSLTELFLHYNRVGDRGMAALADGMKRSLTMQRLQCFGLNVSRSVIEARTTMQL